MACFGYGGQISEVTFAGRSKIVIRLADGSMSRLTFDTRTLEVGTTLDRCSEHIYD